MAPIQQVSSLCLALHAHVACVCACVSVFAPGLAARQVYMRRLLLAFRVLPSTNSYGIYSYGLHGYGLHSHRLYLPHPAKHQ